MLLSKEFKFDAAHHLTKYHGKCEKVHGHTYKLVIRLEGTLNEEDMIYDFVQLKKIVNDNIINNFDHNDLNTIFDNPTAEKIAIYVWDKLDKLICEPNCKLYEVEVWETATSAVIYNGR